MCGKWSLSTSVEQTTSHITRSPLKHGRMLLGILNFMLIAWYMVVRQDMTLLLCLHYTNCYHCVHLTVSLLYSYRIPDQPSRRRIRSPSSSSDRTRLVPITRIVLECEGEINMLVVELGRMRTRKCLVPQQRRIQILPMVRIE